MGRSPVKETGSLDKNGFARESKREKTVAKTPYAMGGPCQEICSRYFPPELDWNMMAQNRDGWRLLCEDM